MITHTIDTYRIPSKKKDKVNDINFGILQRHLQAKHHVKLLDEGYEYEMDPGHCSKYREGMIPSPDGWTDRVKPVYPHFNFVEAAGV